MTNLADSVDWRTDLSSQPVYNASVAFKLLSPAEVVIFTSGEFKILVLQSVLPTEFLIK